LVIKRQHATNTWFLAKVVPQRHFPQQQTTASRRWLLRVPSRFLMKALHEI
jgi:hypothetical protein